MTTTTDIVVAGGSYAGLAVAVALARESGGELHVMLVSPGLPALDAGAGGVDDVRASALSRGSLNLLQHLGAWDEIAAHAQPVSAIEITDSNLDDAIRPTALSYALDRGHAGSSLPSMVIVENRRLGAALHRAAKAAAGVTLAAGAAIADFVADQDGVQATLSDGTTIAARLLVAADGARSKLREAGGIKSIGWPYRQRGIVTFVEPEQPHEGRAVQHFLPAGPFALLPMTGDRICITWTEGDDEAHRILALDAAGFRAEVERRFGYRLGALKTIAPPQSWPLELDVARGLIGTRMALIGDAAHKVHPIAGQGLNLGFRDVAALSETIIDAARLGLDFGRPETLERYERWRRFDNLASAAGFDALNRMFSSDNTLARSARGAVLGIADRLEGVKGWLVGEAAGERGDVPRLLRGR